MTFKRELRQESLVEILKSGCAYVKWLRGVLNVLFMGQSCPVYIFFSKQKQVKPQRKCIVKESCNSCSLQGLGANMAEAESSTDQRMLRGGGGDVWGGYLRCSALDYDPVVLTVFLLINPSWWIMHPVIENFRSVWSLKSWFPHSSGTVQSVIPPPSSLHTTQTHPALSFLLSSFFPLSPSVCLLSGATPAARDWVLIDY